ncbi:MAG: orotidine-5'-phosphate decarboxylase [Cellvibrionales bacterium]|jgi:orotidine-5'-phosphate decarboxylase|nr:orotidine-5'-phosphate decarboxylase [Cellvibrionales bacterium]
MVDTKGPLIVALDFDTATEALDLVDLLDPDTCRVKVGKQLFTREGPAILKALGARGFDVFLDLKFHDIPNTVANACVAAAEQGAWMVNVHASGGSRMMVAARDALAKLSNPPKLIAVTVLTSMAPEDLFETGTPASPMERVLLLAELAQQAGMDGVVCSAQEAQQLRARLGPDFNLVTPGIRLPEDNVGDQRRVLSPSDALAAGANYLVVGRPITAASDPAGALERILSSIEAD